MDATWLAKAGVPKRYLVTSWDEVTPAILQPLREYCDNIGANLRDGYGMTLLGPYGVGKTFGAVLVLDAALAAGLPRSESGGRGWDAGVGAFVLASEMSVALHAPSREDHAERIALWRRCRCLVIDDWHKMYLGPEWDRTQLQALMDVRHAECRATVLTINDTSVFEALPGVFDRLRESTNLVTIPDDEPSRRGR